jgi:hypothetical protein
MLFGGLGLASHAYCTDVSKPSLFETAADFLDDREFFSAHKDRAVLVGSLVYCQEQTNVDQLSAQNLTGGQLEEYYFGTTTSNEEALNNFSKAMMFIAGYSFGVELGYDLLAEENIELTGLCSRAVTQAKQELSKAVPHRDKKFRKKIEKVFPALGPLYDTLYGHIEAAYLLDVTNGRDAALRYFTSVQFDGKFKQLAQGNLVSISNDQHDIYYLLAFIFLQGAVEGKVDVLKTNFSEEQFNSFKEDLTAKSLKIIE